MPLHPGLKVGPTDWRNRLEASGAQYCEVWYHAQEPKKYEKLFKYLQKHQIATGLHFWGTIDEKWEPNIAYPGPTLEKTLSLIKTTIDVANAHHFHYINIHCGNRKLINVDLVKQHFVPDEKSPEIPLDQAESIQRQSLNQLNVYAQKQKVLFLVETVPANVPTRSFHTPNARLQAVDQYTLPVATLIRRAQLDGIHITNDFCHTFADEFDKPLDGLWQALWKKSVALAPSTKLIHINTIIPPYNGTDTHNGITQTDFKLPGVFPDKEKLKQLLKLFKARNDVWAIGEPSTDHVGNYQALTQLISKL